jgi:hypothetical protein
MAGVRDAQKRGVRSDRINFSRSFRLERRRGTSFIKCYNHVEQAERQGNFNVDAKIKTAFIHALSVVSA